MFISNTEANVRPPIVRDVNQCGGDSGVFVTKDGTTIGFCLDQGSLRAEIVGCPPGQYLINRATRDPYAVEIVRGKPVYKHQTTEPVCMITNPETLPPLGGEMHEQFEQLHKANE